MDPKYFLGIQEIDAQHEEISDLVTSLQKVIARKDQSRLVDQSLKRLNQLLMTHFEYEESMMAMVRHRELPQHRKVHKSILKLFSDHFEHPESPGDFEHFVKLIGEKVFSHVIEHDVRMIAQIKESLPSLKHHAKQNKKLSGKTRQGA